MSYSISRKFLFCAGHRIYQHESKCNFLHGHNYKAIVTIHSEELDHLGRVVDFFEIKKIIGDWIDKNWDHNFILYEKDPIKDIISNYCKNATPYIMSGNPTVENLSKELFENCVEILPSYIRLKKVKIWETENCYAEYNLQEGLK